jgi:nucleotide-binding universal stress UspA family protein
MKKILLATDGSPSADAATDEAIKLAQETGSALHVVTAWTIPISGFAPPMIGVTSELAEAVNEQAAQALADAVGKAKAAGLGPTPILRRGFAAEEICAVAREIGADMIVMGTHGWSGLKRAFLGSVSAQVLHDAPCSVLVVPGEPSAAGRKADARTLEAVR